jgi:glucose-6-phosphate dehydrogenase assembly protein OpcA
VEETLMSATVAPDKILKELAALWTQQGKEGESGVLRACSMTLLVMADAGDDSSALGETIAALMPQHPARSILIRLSGDGERALSERVYQQCWKPFGQRQQICCEQIEITASDAALADLPSVLLPLVVADLPVILWCRCGRVAERPEFNQIARIATRVVLDTGSAANATDTIWRLADSVRRGMVLADLAWTRLTRWRETLSRVFENRDTLTRLGAAKTIQVSYGEGYDTAAWYFAAWVSDCLSDVRVKAKVRVAAGAPTLRVDLAGEGLQVTLSREEERLVTTVNEQTNCTNLPRASDYLAMREELSIVTSDVVFERTLASAARLTVSSAERPPEKS